MSEDLLNTGTGNVSNTGNDTAQITETDTSSTVTDAQNNTASPSNIKDAQAESDKKTAPDNSQPDAIKDAGNKDDKANNSKTDKKEDQSDATGVDEADQPVTDWSKVDVKFPDGFDVNQESLKSFGDTVVKNGLTAKQAQALIDWQFGEIKAQMQALREIGEEDLQKEWGGKLEENKAATRGLIQRIDRMLGGSGDEFSKALAVSGAANQVGVVKGLYKLSQLIAEDSMGRGTAGSEDQAEDAYQGLVNALNEQRKRRG